MLSRALLAARTVRHLRWRQVAYRVVRRVQPARPRATPSYPGLDEARLPALHAAVLRWAAHQPRLALAALRRLDEGQFHFLGHTEQIAAIDWRQRYVSHLWNYNLHYFDYATWLALAYVDTGDAAFAKTFERLTLGWIAATRDGRGDGWQPYALSVRITNWSRALLLFGQGLPSESREAIARSLFEQIHALRHRLEWHVLANHLQKNLHALLMGSLLFDGPVAERWQRFALRQVAAQLDEQVLPDGGHYERTPAYHALALADLLEALLLLGAAGEAIPATMPAHAKRMTAALARLTHPDGSLHLFNDSANGVAPPTAALTSLAAAVVGELAATRDGAWSLPDTRYVGARSGGDALIVDVGAPAPSYQPGHAHCGLLGFELDRAGRQIVVDSGVHGYEGDPYREFVRSTRAHSTVMIGGREQSELWATFRAARRAVVTRVEATLRGDVYRVAAAYRPYHDRRAEHAREIVCEPATLVVSDQVRGATGALLDSFVHLHPDAAASLVGDEIHARIGDLAITIAPFGVDAVTLHTGERAPLQGWFCPEFGVALRNTVVQLQVAHNSGEPFGYRITITTDSPAP